MKNKGSKDATSLKAGWSLRAQMRNSCQERAVSFVMIKDLESLEHLCRE